MENIQENFFSKNNITVLNNKLLNDLNANNTNSKDKQYITSALIKHMKTTWKKIDASKINKSNAQSIFSQFNSISFKNTYSELNELINKKKTKDPNSLKFERDFKSNPNNGVTYMERSPSILEDNQTTRNSFLGPNEDYIIKNQQLQKTANNFDSGLDNLFRPLIADPPNEPSFNNYQTKKHSGDDFQSRLKDIQSSRNDEVPTGHKVEREIPDFLKSKNTNVRVNDQEPPPNKFVNKTNNESIDLEFLDAVNYDDNLYSLDNIDKLLINDSIEEDTAPFAERLKKLESERNNIRMPKQSIIDFQSDTFEDTYAPVAERLKKLESDQNNIRMPKQSTIDFQADTFEDNSASVAERLKKLESDRNNIRMPKQSTIDFQADTFEDNFNILNNYEPTIINKNIKKHETERNQKHEMERNQKQNEMERMQRQQEMERNKKQQEIEKQIELEKELEKKKIFENYLKEKELEKNELLNNIKPKSITTHKDIFDQLKNLNKNLLSQITILKKELEDIKLDKVLQFNQIKDEISQEFNNLQKIKLYNENKIQEINIKENELSLRENELSLRENEFDKLYRQYSSLIKTKKYQLEIAPDNSISNYRFNLTSPINITGIKLLNYSIPNKKYNIEETINNVFSFIINNNSYTIELLTGFYTIESLIEKLNINEFINFKLDIFTQKLQIDSDHILQLINTNLSYILGFKNYESSSNHILADVIYDLRIDTKVYLYINNIAQTPFAILNPSGNTTESEMKFEDIIQIEYLDIIFKDAKGNDINFYNVDHYLNVEVVVEDKF